jgi:hypothetical protein
VKAKYQSGFPPMLSARRHWRLAVVADDKQVECFHLKTDVFSRSSDGN